MIGAMTGVFESRKLRNRYFALSVLIFLAGVIAFLVVFLRDTGKTPAATSSGPPQTVPAPPKNVAAPPEAEAVARRFVLTAVFRRDLPAAWRISGPGIRQDLTYKQWLTGNIPVVPIFDRLLGASYKTDLATKNEVDLEVALIVKPAKSSDGKAKIFDVVVRKYPQGWRVDSWVPHVPVQIPRNPGS